jgi:hypothetical protein
MMSCGLATEKYGPLDGHYPKLIEPTLSLSIASMMHQLLRSPFFLKNLLGIRASL